MISFSPACASILPRMSVLLLLALAVPAAAQDAEPSFFNQTKARQALIVDGETRAVLLEKNADIAFGPASLAKLMTMEIVFDALKRGEISLTDSFTVSEHAWRTGGAPSRTSTMFAAVKSSVTVDALLQGAIVQAANDACIVLAEGMSGSEAAFAQRMNRRAAEIGLTGSHFVNPTGLPAEGQSVTARDLVTLARHIETTYPEYYRLYSQPEFEWNKILQRNRNPLLRLDIGATGMGTGFTEASGYSLVGVTERGGRKTFIALGGLASDAERAREAETLLKWANDTFERREVFSADEIVGHATVYGGTVPRVSLRTAEDVVAYVPNASPDLVKAVMIYDGPLRAPIEKGQKIGRVEMRIENQASIVRDLFAGEDVPQGTFSSRALDAAHELAFGWIRAL
ncbi:D-alanyl-D-alanine carboxypeptidase family protein [Aureimonas altamirensis]|uniref:D-alanyl-D-alanine carboxypeptidase family protein n=1 Tax=Aureimonas altamirensis TaxID=370622 RepID=UPI0025537A10|nr:D-alanyl-D-alanine carboxypeptidase family protein [Aureimonas altamirensis]